MQTTSATHTESSNLEIKDLGEQIVILREKFPTIGPANMVFAQRELPSMADGWFAIPQWQKVAVDYDEALPTIFEAIEHSRDHTSRSFLDTHLRGKSLMLSPTTGGGFDRLIEAQGHHDILVVPVHLGSRYRGKKVRTVRDSMAIGEFGLDSFSVGCVLLTHPELLTHYTDPAIACPGSYHHGRSAPYFYYGCDGVSLEACDCEALPSLDAYVSLTGFVPGLAR